MIILLAFWFLVGVVIGVRLFVAVFFTGLDRLGEWMQREFYR